MDLQKYSELISDVALNVKDGDIIRIKTDVQNLDFVRTLAEECYKKGAHEVYTILNDERLTRLNMNYMSEERLSHFGKYHLDEALDYAESGTKYVSVVGGDPDIFKGIDPKKIQLRTKTVSSLMKPVMKYTMNDINSWTVIGYPSKSWAKTVFPDLTEDEAVKKLAEAIEKAIRLDQCDPKKAWEDHIDRLEKTAKFLNEKNFDKLIYTSDSGTNLEIGLPEGHIWVSATSVNAKGEKFLPNLPTEEVFTAPDRNRVNGIVYATKPLFAAGLIKDFYVKFKDGKAIDYKAEVGHEFLKNLIETDEGSAFLGEVALVEDTSPINKSGIIFYNTLFDENASCHLALGKAYPTCVKNGENMTDEKLIKIGVNDSSVHDDFMIGDNTLKIVGVTKEGEEILIMEKGVFVYEG